jgi:PAS domain S-box-containing protein
MYQRMVDDAPVAVIVADAEGSIRFWNAAASEIFGFTQSEALDHTLDLIVPEAQRARHWAGYRNVMQTGETRYGRQQLAVPAMRKDGSRISVEFHVVLLRDDAGKLVGIAAFLRDVTDRWQRERALTQRVRELESELVEPLSS